ncbi:hypothetical protein [Luteolibacter sp. LG18]|uniref:hypothetical protein n=1 Tax=Luteolibacter sp. LG18 TaxID=2819286 RepID=UPI0030C6F73C
MKTIVLLLCGTAIAAAAPRKIWTWDPGPHGNGGPSPTYRALHATGSDEKGDTAFIIGEISSDLSSNFRYRIVWLNAKGTVIKDDPIDASSETYAAVLGAEDSSRDWQVLSVTATTLVVSTSTELRTYSLKGKTVTLTTRTVDSGSDPGFSDFIKPAGKSEFAGWYERKMQRGPMFVYTGGTSQAFDILEISAWSEK